MSSIDLLESKLSTLLSKLATLEVNKLSFNSKFPDGIDVGGGTAGPQGPIGPQGPQGDIGPMGPQGLIGNWTTRANRQYRTSGRYWTSRTSRFARATRKYWTTRANR